MMCVRLIPVLFLFVVILPQFEAFAGERGNPWINTLYFENDLFTGTDRNYTNGVKYSLVSPDVSPAAPEQPAVIPRRVLEYLQTLPFIAGSAAKYSHQGEFSFGQNMFTPADISKTDLIPDDRPYAGWSYFGLAYHRKNRPEGARHFMDTVEIQFGMVGPESFAEETQKFVHDLRDLQRPNGWDNQLDNEPGINLVFERKWLFHPGFDKLGYDAITHAGFSLGNVSTYVNTGIELRCGWNVPVSFGISHIRPAGATRLIATKEFSIYLFAAADSRMVLRDIFLDGNTFTDSHEVSKKFFVADLSAGMAVNYRRITLTWAQILRTREFEAQPDDHSFGSISLSFALF